MKTHASSKNRNSALDRNGRKVLGSRHSQPATLHVLDAPLHHCDVTVDSEWRLAMIAQAAYCRAERRGFEPGHELEDWLAAEQGIDAELTVGHTPVPKFA